MFKYLEKIKDPRKPRNQDHLFITLIGTAFFAILAGFDSFSGMADFIELNLEKFKKYFDFPNGPASHDTYQRLFDAINPDELNQGFFEFTSNLAKIIDNTSKDNVLNLDGKTIRNSGKTKPLHILSAFCSGNQLTLAQKKVDQKSNEITAIPKLMKLLDLRNRIVTIDAIGAQRDICEQIINQDGDYLIAIKGNQKTLYEDVKMYFQNLETPDLASFTEHDVGHGRIETRRAYTLDRIDYLVKTHKWPGLKSIGLVVSTVLRGEKEVTEKRFYISSLEANAELFNKTARAHWGIENKLHWRLDVIFNEDKCCIRNDNAADNMDTMRKWALNVLQRCKEKPSQSIKSIMRKNCISFTHLEKCIKRVFALDGDFFHA